MHTRISSYDKPTGRGGTRRDANKSSRVKRSRDLWYQEAVIAVMALAATFITDRAINLEQSDGSQASKYLKR